MITKHHVNIMVEPALVMKLTANGQPMAGGEKVMRIHQITNCEDVIHKKAMRGARDVRYFLHMGAIIMAQ